MNYPSPVVYRHHIRRLSTPVHKPWSLSFKTLMKMGTHNKLDMDFYDEGIFAGEEGAVSDRWLSEQLTDISNRWQGHGWIDPAFGKITRRAPVKSHPLCFFFSAINCIPFHFPLPSGALFIKWFKVDLSSTVVSNMLVRQWLWNKQTPSIPVRFEWTYAFDGIKQLRKSDVWVRFWPNGWVINLIVVFWFKLDHTGPCSTSSSWPYLFDC